MCFGGRAVMLWLQNWWFYLYSLAVNVVFKHFYKPRSWPQNGDKKKQKETSNRSGSYGGTPADSQLGKEEEKIR